MAVFLLRRTACGFALGERHWLEYNSGFDFSLRKEEDPMEAERINALTALLADLTSREAELRRYL